LGEVKDEKKKLVLFKLKRMREMLTADEKLVRRVLDFVSGTKLMDCLRTEG